MGIGKVRPLNGILTVINMRIKLLLSKIKLFDFILFAILILYTISLFVPLAWGLLTSIKSRSDFVTNIFGLPKKWMFDNYPKAFSNFWVKISYRGTTKTVLLWEMLLNSIIYTGGSTLVTTLTPCITAYLVAKYSFKFNKVVFNTVIIVMLIPIVGNMPSMLNLMYALNLYDTFIGIILMKINFCTMYFLVFYGTFKSLSRGYAEAAFIDGASHVKVMFYIMLPLVKTTIGVVALLNFIALWNDYMIPMVFWPSRPTAALGMFIYSKNNLVNSIPDQMSGCMIFVFPILVLFLLFQKKMMGNLTIGGLKG